MHDTKRKPSLSPPKHETFIHKVLHLIERTIAVMTLFVLIGMLFMELYRLNLDVEKVFTVPEYFLSLEAYLHNILTIVVGLEFVRMLLDMTPANTIEVLIVAISRHVILSHDDALSNVASILCIAGLFATRRFLISKKEMTIELSEVE